MARPFSVRVLLAAAVLVLAACNQGEPEAADDGTSAMDTTNQEAMDGMPARQVEEQARPLSQEEAAQRGLIVDTTTSVGDPGRDSIPGAPGVDPGSTRTPAETTGTTAAPATPAP